MGRGKRAHTTADAAATRRQAATTASPRTLASFAEARDLVVEVHQDILRLYGYSRGSCQLASELLAARLLAAGYSPKVVDGCVLVGPVEEEHCWVTVNDVILDPTCDQFGGDPASEPDEWDYDRVFSEDDPDPAAAARLLRAFASGNPDKLKAAEQTARRYKLPWPPPPPRAER